MQFEHRSCTTECSSTTSMSPIPVDDRYLLPSPAQRVLIVVTSQADLRHTPLCLRILVPRADTTTSNSGRSWPRRYWPAAGQGTAVALPVTMTSVFVYACSSPVMISFRETTSIVVPGPITDPPSTRSTRRITSSGLAHPQFTNSSHSSPISTGPA